LSLYKRSGNQWAPLLDRNLVKSNTMTLVYGAREGGAMSDANFELFEEAMSAELAADAGPALSLFEGARAREQAREQSATLEDVSEIVGIHTWAKYRRRGYYMATFVRETVRKLMPKAGETMDWLQKLAAVLGKDGKFISWQTPSGFPFL